MVVNSPERVTNERDLANEELKLIQEQFEVRLSTLHSLQTSLSGKEEALSKVHLVTQTIQGAESMRSISH